MKLHQHQTLSTLMHWRLDSATRNKADWKISYSLFQQTFKKPGATPSQLVLLVFSTGLVQMNLVPISLKPKPRVLPVTDLLDPRVVFKEIKRSAQRIDELRLTGSSNSDSQTSHVVRRITGRKDSNWFKPVQPSQNITKLWTTTNWSRPMSVNATAHLHCEPKGTSTI